MREHFVKFWCCFLMCITLYLCVNRVCASYDNESNNALGFRALELGYNGKIDIDKLLLNDSGD